MVNLSLTQMPLGDAKCKRWKVRPGHRVLIEWPSRGKLTSWKQLSEWHIQFAYLNRMKFSLHCLGLCIRKKCGLLVCLHVADSPIAWIWKDHSTENSITGPNPAPQCALLSPLKINQILFYCCCQLYQPHGRLRPQKIHVCVSLWKKSLFILPYVVEIHWSYSCYAHVYCQQCDTTSAEKDCSFEERTVRFYCSLWVYVSRPALSTKIYFCFKEVCEMVLGRYG